MKRLKKVDERLNRSMQVFASTHSNIFERSLPNPLFGSPGSGSRSENVIDLESRGTF